MIREDYVVFHIDGQGCAVPLAAVRRIVRAAALSPVPDAPRDLLGLLNLHGRLVPVYDVTISLGHPPKPLSPRDRFLIVDNGTGPAGIRADEVRHIGRLEPESTLQSRRILNDRGLFGAVAQCDGKTVLLVDPAVLGKRAVLTPKAVNDDTGEVMELTLRSVPSARHGHGVGAGL